MCGDERSGYARSGSEVVSFEGEEWAELKRRSQALHVPDEEDNLRGFGLSDGAVVLLIIAIGAVLEWWLR